MPEASRPGKADKRVRGYVEELAAALADILGPPLVGVYLHGSAATGDFVQNRSDVDLLLVTSRPLSQQQKRDLASLVTRDKPAHPDVATELNAVTAETASRPGLAPSFELHINDKHPTQTLVDGADRGGNPDLLAEFAVCRESGISLIGPPPKKVFSAIPPDWLVAASLDDLDWWEQTLAGGRPLPTAS